MKSRQYIKFISYLQIIGIILVVFGHSFHEYPDGSMGKNLLLYRMPYSFRMPLFMFVSGFLMVFTTRLRQTSRPSVSKFTHTKIKRLLIPFATLTLVSFIPRSMMSGMADDSISLNFTSFCRAFIYSEDLIIPYFWFLQASFILLILNYFLISCLEKAKINNTFIYIFLISLAIVVQLLPVGYTTFFSINRAIDLWIYFILGASYSQFSAHIDRYVPWTNPLFLIIVLCLWAISFFTTYDTPWHIICSIFGITMCISFAKMLEFHNIKILDHLRGANYMIFLLSWYCNVGCQQLLHHYTDFPWWVYSILSLVAGVYIPWLAYRYMQTHSKNAHIRLSAFLLGQSLKAKTGATVSESNFLKSSTK